jgi:hypothetical protein
MRSPQLRSPSFAVGFTLGLVLTGVTFALGRAVKRHFGQIAKKEVAHPAIDTIRLESETEDPPVNSQRW